MKKNEEIEDLKVVKEISKDNVAEEHAVSKTEVYMNMSKNIKKALEEEKSTMPGLGRSIQNQPRVKSPWSNYNKAAYVDAAILGLLTLAFGVAIILRVFL